jgi:Fe-S cluster biogenesis protein NfuA/nitrite reductase/ring-hydroxylating ferredoxin subunit
MTPATGGPRTDPQEVGQHIEELLTALAAHSDPMVGEAAEDLARDIVGMYGAGLERIVTLLAGAGPAGAATLAELAGDDLVAGLLVLHDLHPEDTAARAARALERVRPYLGSHAGDVDLLGVAEGVDGPVVRLALTGSCDGCPSSAVTVTTAIERAIEELCPEVVRVEVAGVVTPAPRALPVLQIGLGPPEPDPPPVAWVGLEPPPLRPGQCARLEVAGAEVLLALPAGAHAAGNGLVAYLDRCPSCEDTLEGATLAGDKLTCAGCAAGYDVRRAGRALDGTAAHLEPLPLEQRAGGWKVAVPRQPAGAVS